MTVGRRYHAFETRHTRCTRTYTPINSRIVQNNDRLRLIRSIIKRFGDQTQTCRLPSTRRNPYQVHLVGLFCICSTTAPLTSEKRAMVDSKNPIERNGSPVDISRPEITRKTPKPAIQPMMTCCGNSRSCCGLTHTKEGTRPKRQTNK